MAAELTRIKLSDERKQRLLEGLVKLYYNEFDEDLSEFQAERVLDYFVRALGPQVYNQAITDARTFMAGKLEDLDVEFREVESGG